jgi:hyperosmotically inducible protein
LDVSRIRAALVRAGARDRGTAIFTRDPAWPRRSLVALSIGSAPATTGGVAPATNNPGVADGTKDATNTKINDRDRHGALTPMDQGGGADRDITAAIRRAAVGDKALSFTAKNVKIITVGGKVTLRGPVKSDEEKSLIESKAKAATGVSSVDNQLEVKK